MLKSKLVGDSAVCFVLHFIKKVSNSKKQQLSMNALLCSWRLTRASMAISDCSIVIFNCRQSKNAKILLEADYDPERRYNAYFISNMPAMEFEQVQSIVLMLLPIKVVLYLKAEHHWYQDNSQLRAYLALLDGAQGVSPARRALVCVESFDVEGSEWHEGMFSDVSFAQRPLDYLEAETSLLDPGQTLFKTRFLKMHGAQDVQEIGWCSSSFVEGGKLKLMLGPMFEADRHIITRQRDELLNEIELVFISPDVHDEVSDLVVWLNSFYKSKQMVLEMGFTLFDPVFEDLNIDVHDTDEDAEERERLINIIVACATEFNESFNDCAQACGQNNCVLQMSIYQSVGRIPHIIGAQWREAVIRGVPGFQNGVMSEENGMRKLEVERQIDRHQMNLAFTETL